MEKQMKEQYMRMAKVFKALSDPKRVQILDVLSGGEMCGCVLLEHFQVSQPTLCHDLKLLTDAGIVMCRRDGQRKLYSLNMEALQRFQKKLKTILADGQPGEDTAPENEPSR